MGMFDNIFQNLDKALKEVESGGLEQKLNNFADMVDKTSKKVATTTEQLAGKPAELLEAAEAKREALEEKAKVIQTHAGKTMDVIRRKETT